MIVPSPYHLGALLLAASLLSTTSALAQDGEIRTEQVRVDPGQTSTTLVGALTGYEIVDYRVGAQAGQTLSVSMSTDNTAAYFNLLAPGETDVAFFVGSVKGLSYRGTLPTSGDYTLRVYQMRSAARRGEVAQYRIDVWLAIADFADGQAGRPDFWIVSGVTSALNMRDVPSIDGTVIARLANGTMLRNKGCRLAQDRRWCHVERVDADATSGWVANDYLVEGQYIPDAAEDARVPGTKFNATGRIPCARVNGQPMTDCRFGVIREGHGSGMITVFWPDTGNRVIFYASGTPSGYDESEADGGARLSFDKEEDLFRVRIGEQRFDIPKAIMSGG